MWNYCRKFASIGGLSKGITKLRSTTTAIFIHTTRAYYGDYIYSNEKSKSALPVVKPISEFFIKPKFEVKESNKPYHLGPLDLDLLSWHHIQIGFLYKKPSHINDEKFSMHEFLQSLKESLSLTLVHFYPLAGQLVSEVDEDKHESRVYVDCNKGPGARFIHAALAMSISNVLSPKDDVSLVVQSFFDLNEEVVNYDDHIKPLLCVQVTELLDGVFIACCVNHCMMDGTSYWQFWSIWSEIHRGNNGTPICESRLPVYYRWLPNGRDFPILLPFIRRDEIVRKFETPQLKERIFQFSFESIARLKAKANEEGKANNISSFQALCALVWRSIIRANRPPDDQVVNNHLVANMRDRLNPPLPKYYFGNFSIPFTISTTARELLENNLGWAASLLHQSVANLNDNSVREYINEWLKSPNFYHHADYFDCNSVMIQNSPRFDMYGNDFGIGKAVGFRFGCANKATGVVYACPGINEKGSVDLLIYLPDNSMNALESDEEFTSFISSP